MREYLASLAGAEYVDAILWTLAALVLLAVVLGIVKAVRTMNSGTFVAGGRARKTRLAVMDATAVDSQRRLVLVRRDDVEHLLLIGGTNDIVVEQDIRVMGQARRSPLAEPQRPVVEEDGVPARAPEPPAPPRQAPQLSPPHVGQPQPTVERPVRPAPEAQRQISERPAPSRQASAQRPLPAPVPRTAPPVVAQPGRPQSSAPTRRPTEEELDAALLSELDLAADDIAPPAQKPQSQAQSLDDEMAKLLGELAAPKR